MPFLAPGDLDRAGCPVDAVVVANPLDANESVLRTSLRPGLLKALAYNASHRAARRPPLRDRAGLPATVGRRRSDPPGRARAAGRRPRGDATPSRPWGCCGCSPDRSAPRSTLEAAARPGLHATRTAAGARRRSRWWASSARSIRRSSRPSTSPVGSGWLELDLDGLLGERGGPRQARPVSTYPSSDLDLAFEVADDDAGRRGRGHDPVGGRRPAGVARPVRRLPGRGGAAGAPVARLPAPAPGAGPHADRRRDGRAAPAGDRRGRVGTLPASLRV